jgi:hypothetical protein
MDSVDRVLAPDGITNEPIALAAYLLAGRTRSCGCLRAERARASIALTRAQRRSHRPRAAVAVPSSSST